MTLRDWLSDTSQRIRTDGLPGTVESGWELYIGALRRVNEVYPRGTNVYDLDWDLLILLDGCRVDLIHGVEADWPFLNRSDTLTSVGSSSLQWLEGTFAPAYRPAIEQTVYVTANPFSHRVQTLDWLLELDEVWRYAFDEERGTIPARPVTDRAVRAAREHDPDRLIVHYMQPHFPSIPDPLGGELNRETLGEGAGWESPWDQVRRGEQVYDRVWASYRRNLKYVLEDVELLLQNVDAECAVISADHGNATGEWGIYGHPRVPLDALRTVPWYRTSASDDGTFDPTLERGDDQHGVDDTLEALGYLG